MAYSQGSPQRATLGWMISIPLGLAAETVRPHTPAHITIRRHRHAAAQIPTGFHQSALGESHPTKSPTLKGLYHVDSSLTQGMAKVRPSVVEVE